MLYDSYGIFPKQNMRRWTAPSEFLCASVRQPFLNPRTSLSILPVTANLGCLLTETFKKKLKTDFFHTLYSDHSFPSLISSKTLPPPHHPTPQLVSLFRNQTGKQQTNKKLGQKKSTEKQKKKHQRHMHAEINTHECALTHKHTIHKSTKLENICKSKRQIRLKKNSRQSIRRQEKILQKNLSSF